MHMTDDDHVAPLLQAYLEADYRWELDGAWHGIRVARTAPDLEAAFPQATRFCLLTAWNPQSQPQPEAANRAADDALHAVLLASGLPYRPGFSSAANRSWREPSWLVVDLDEDTLDALARRFDQLATLSWSRGEPVRLRMYADRVPGGPDPECVDRVGHSAAMPSRIRAHGQSTG